MYSLTISPSLIYSVLRGVFPPFLVLFVSANAAKSQDVLTGFIAKFRGEANQASTSREF
jgi:hypothetical protein